MAISQKLLDVLVGYRYPLGDEKQLQHHLEQKLIEHDLSYQREVLLMNQFDEPCGLIDFLIDGVGVELKVKGQKMATYRQIVRYCESSAIKQIVLLTNRTMGLPQLINGKPCTVISLGMAHL